MNLSDARKIVRDYKDIYEELRAENRWFAGDQRILMMAASMYVVNSKPFSLDRYMELVHYIKKKSSMFSPLKSHQRFVTAAMLDQRFDDPEDKFHELTDLYDQLVKGGFGRGAFTYIAALVLLSGDPDGSDHTASIKNSVDVYKGMRKNHPFITSKNDYPLSVMLAQLEEDNEVLMDRVENYYRKLDQNGFRKGNDLQFLSHILALEKDAHADDRIASCLRVWDDLKRRKVKLKASHYPATGLLTLAEPSSDDLDLIVQLTEELNQTKRFKWHRDMNIMMAVNFTVKGKMDNHELLQTGIHTTMETIIQAQQAAMIAAVTAGAAASSSSSNN